MDVPNDDHLLEELDRLYALLQQWLDREQLTTSEYAAKYGAEALTDDTTLLVQTRQALSE